VDTEKTGVWKMIRVPAVVTLAVTLLRLAGELNNWSPVLFNRSAGGGGAIVGIVWLAFIFAIYFAVKLQNHGEAPENRGRMVWLAVAALVVNLGGGFLIFASGDFSMSWRLAAGVILVAVSLWIMRLAWPAFWNVMMAYAIAARVPVIVVMYFAVLRNWGTHYDVVPPEVPAFSSATTKFLAVGLFPQVIAWIPFTVVFAALPGVITVALRKRQAAAKLKGALS
jgi:hypothetical protein